jgi:hypothetical protein
VNLDPTAIQSPWPERPSWGFAAFTIAVMLLAVFLVWLSNWSEVREIRKGRTGEPSRTSERRPPSDDALQHRSARGAYFFAYICDMTESQPRTAALTV